MEAKRMAKKDIINSLPSTVIENILCRVSLRDAVRTSILSRNWRYNWTTIPKLVLNVYDMFTDSYEMTRNCKVCAMNQVLFLHQGPLLELTLAMCVHERCVEIDQIILHSSRKNTIKKLELNFSVRSLHKLPLSVLSFHQLTDLSLSRCVFEFSPTFSGFANLTSLSLYYVHISTETLVHLISSCPLLKCFLYYQDSDDEEDGLSVDLNELVKCLPLIEHLTVNSGIIERFAKGQVPTTTLVCLRSLCMTGMLFDCKFQLPGLFLLIRSSPNLEKIKLELIVNQLHFIDHPIDNWVYESIMYPTMDSLDDHSNIWLKRLTELEIQKFSSLEIEMEFVKLILAKSPVLKKVRIVLAKEVQDDKEVKLLRILLRFPRASPVAEIIVRR